MYVVFNSIEHVEYKTKIPSNLLHFLSFPTFVEQQLIADIDLYYWLLLFYVEVTVGTMHIHRRFILTVIFLNKEHHGSCHKLIFLNK